MVLNARELVEAERGLNICHIVLVARLDDVVMLVSFIAVAFPRISAHAMEREDAHPFRIVYIICDCHTALGSNEIFRRIKTEASNVADRANFPPLILTLHSVRRVLDDFE